VKGHDTKMTFKTKLFIDFRDELGLFNGETPIFTKNFLRSVVCRDFMAVQMKSFVRMKDPLV
jgi:hypothetical protein